MGLTTSAELTIGQDIHLGGPWTMARATVGGGGYIRGKISVSGSASLAGTLYHQSGAVISGPFVAGAIVKTSVNVAPPCDCRPSQLVPVQAIVAAHAGTANDNAKIRLDPNVFAKTRTSDARLDLPCGNYYLSKIAAGGAVTIHVRGNTALYIGGDITLGSALTFSLEPTAEFDVFISGAICSSSTLNVGSANFPARMRIYIGGTSRCGKATGSYSAFLDNRVAIAGNVYAPYGQYFSGAKILHYGAIFAKSYVNSAATTIHFDRAVLAAARSCKVPSTPPDAGPGDAGGNDGSAADAGSGGCSSCRDCLNEACIKGQCAACTQSSQCCAPLSCVKGRCLIANVIP